MVHLGSICLLWLTSAIRTYASHLDEVHLSARGTDLYLRGIDWDEYDKSIYRRMTTSQGIQSGKMEKSRTTSSGSLASLENAEAVQGMTTRSGARLKSPKAKSDVTDRVPSQSQRNPANHALQASTGLENIRDKSHNRDSPTPAGRSSGYAPESSLLKSPSLADSDATGPAFNSNTVQKATRLGTEDSPDRLRLGSKLRLSPRRDQSMTPNTDEPSNFIVPPLSIGSIPETPPSRRAAEALVRMKNTRLPPGYTTDQLIAGGRQAQTPEARLDSSKLERRVVKELASPLYRRSKKSRQKSKNNRNKNKYKNQTSNNQNKGQGRSNNGGGKNGGQGNGGDSGSGGKNSGKQKGGVSNDATGGKEGKEGKAGAEGKGNKAEKNTSGGVKGLGGSGLPDRKDKSAKLDKSEKSEKKGAKEWPSMGEIKGLAGGGLPAKDGKASKGEKEGKGGKEGKGEKGAKEGKGEQGVQPGTGEKQGKGEKGAKEGKGGKEGKEGKADKVAGGEQRSGGEGKASKGEAKSKSPQGESQAKAAGGEPKGADKAGKAGKAQSGFGFDSIMNFGKQFAGGGESGAQGFGGFKNMAQGFLGSSTAARYMPKGLHQFASQFAGGQQKGGEGKQKGGSEGKQKASAGGAEEGPVLSARDLFLDTVHIQRRNWDESSGLLERRMSASRSASLSRRPPVDNGVQGGRVKKGGQRGTNERNQSHQGSAKARDVTRQPPSLINPRNRYGTQKTRARPTPDRPSSSISPSPRTGSKRRSSDSGVVDIEGGTQKTQANKSSQRPKKARRLTSEAWLARSSPNLPSPHSSGDLAGQNARIQGSPRSMLPSRQSTGSLLGSDPRFNHPMSRPPVAPGGLPSRQSMGSFGGYSPRAADISPRYSGSPRGNLYSQQSGVSLAGQSPRYSGSPRIAESETSSAASTPRPLRRTSRSDKDLWRMGEESD